jgi:hypothetical protein
MAERRAEGQLIHDKSMFPLGWLSAQVNENTQISKAFGQHLFIPKSFRMAPPFKRSDLNDLSRRLSELSPV